MGLNRPRACATVVASLACPQPCSLQSQMWKRLQTGCVTQRAGHDLWEQGCHQLPSPGLFTQESRETEQFPRASQGSVSVTPAPGGAPDPGGSRNGPAPMPVRTPQVEPGPGGMWQQWVLLWGQRGGLGPGYRVTAARAQERGRGAGTSSLDAARASERHREGSAGGVGRGSGPLGTCPEK